MGFFDSFSSFLQGPVGNNLDNDPEDVRKTKRNLNRLGFFDDEIENDFITRKLDTGIKSFQEKKGLRIDGALLPRGETEQAIKRDLSRDSETQYGRDFFAPSFILSAPVGNNRENRNEDVKNVQRGLGGLSFLSEDKLFEPSGIIDSETADGIQDFQRENDLWVDGFLNPDGETQNAINFALNKINDNENKKDNENLVSTSLVSEKDNSEKDEPDCSYAEAALQDALDDLQEAEDELQPLLDELVDLAGEKKSLKDKKERLEKELAELDKKKEEKKDCGLLAEKLKIAQAKVEKLEGQYELALNNAKNAVESNNSAVEQVASEYVEYLTTKILDIIPLRKVLKVLGFAETFGFKDSDKDVLKEVDAAQNSVSDLRSEAFSAGQEAVNIEAQLALAREEVATLKQDFEECENNKKSEDG